MAERQHNIRAASILERSHGNGGHHGSPTANHHSYRGSHRAASTHHADDHTPAQRRSSRVGRHHAENTEDLSGRW